MAFLEFKTDVDAGFSVRHFSIEESLSSCFSVSLSVRSPNPSVDLAAIVGQPASFVITSGYAFANNGGSRIWSGVVAEASLIQSEASGLSAYFIRIVPRLWLLRHRRGYRIFQHLSIPDIADKILTEWNIEPSWSIDRAAYPPLEFKVQYGESDFDFFNRILEEAGIAYYFAGDDLEKSMLTFVDEPHLVPPRQPILPFADNPSGSAEMEYVTKLRVAREVRPGAYAIRDVDFRNPAFPLWGDAQKASSPEDRYEQVGYVPGGFLHEGHKLGQTPFADDQGIARRTPEFGHERANRALVGARVGRDAIIFETNAVDLWPGIVFQIDNHPHADLRADRGLLVTRFSLEGSPDDAWRMSGEAVFADVPYRPPLRTEKPRAYGVQSATVVGPEGQEIHTDEFGRVRVQFPWDREGTEDETSSCWMRVNQGWGGQGYGFLVLPRVGQEVIVAFEQGDPDQPMIVGRAFNATNPVPYTLPENKTISTWKSNSSTGGQGFNEIKFEDKKSDELFYVQAEKNLRKLVKNDETITVGHDREKHVGENETDTTGVDRFEVTGIDRSETTEGNRTTFVGAIRRKLVRKDEGFRTDGSHRKLTRKNADIVVEGNQRVGSGDDAHGVVVGNRSETIEGDQSLIVVDDHYEKVTGSHALQTGKEVHLASGELVAGEATRVATLRGPGGFVAIDAAGVTIKGTVVRINEGGAAGRGRGSHPQLAQYASITDIKKSSRCRVEFRPKDDWNGEFGFDWMRIGGTAEKAGEDVYKMVLDEHGNLDAAGYKSMKSEYGTIPIEIKSPPENLKEYFVPYLNLFPKDTAGTPTPPFEAELKILVEVEENPPDDIELEYDQTLLTLDKKKLNDKTVGAKRVASDNGIKITCDKALTSDREIKVWARFDGEKMLVGQLRVLKNDATVQCTIKILLVKVKTNISGTIRIGSVSEQEKTALRNTLFQALITCEIEEFPHVFDMSTDDNLRIRTVQGTKVYGRYIYKKKATDGPKLTEGLYRDYDPNTHPGSLNFIAYVRSKFLKVAGNATYAQYFTVFAFGDTSNGVGTLGRVEKIGVHNVSLFVPAAGRKVTTMAHETLHGLGLEHTHLDPGQTTTNRKDPYIFELGRTDNIMSYSATRYSTWRRQWIVMKSGV